MSTPQEAVAAIRSGGVVVVPTDTVYGLAADAHDEEAALRLYALKGRDAVQPTAVLFASVDLLLATVGGVGTGVEAVARALLPGPYTFVVPNQRRVFPWLAGERPYAIGVRVPALTGRGAEVLDAAGALVATSANLPGGPDPHALANVPASIRAGAQAEVDGGRVPGTPSTVVDLTGDEPVVLREGAVPAEEALAAIRAALTRS